MSRFSQQHWSPHENPEKGWQTLTSCFIGEQRRHFLWILVIFVASPPLRPVQAANAVILEQV